MTATPHAKGCACTWCRDAELDRLRTKLAIYEALPPAGHPPPGWSWTTVTKTTPSGKALHRCSACRDLTPLPGAWAAHAVRCWRRRAEAAERRVVRLIRLCRSQADAGVDLLGVCREAGWRGTSADELVGWLRDRLLVERPGGVSCHCGGDIADRGPDGGVCVRCGRAWSAS